ncbi:MAG: putative Radical protein, partial [Nitrospira sp.]|nr:putative Radical protein [Nitrospira sp.]
LCSDAPRSLEQIRGALDERLNAGTVSDAEVQESLARMTAKRILYEERGKYFTLAIPEHPYC